jgi:hypothetical protein
MSVKCEGVSTYTGPSLRVAAKNRPYFILVLDGGPATAFGLGFPPSDKDLSLGTPASSGRFFPRNAARQYMSIRSSVVSLKFVAQIEKSNRRSFDFGRRGDLRSR